MSRQDQLKREAAIKAVEFVPDNEYIGIGTGSTVDFFIEALGQSGKKVKGAVSTSPRSSELMRLAVYVDGADEVNHLLQMIKGGGGAHVHEKIVANAADRFICIADESKYVSRLGRFPLPVEVVPLARSMVSRQLVKLGGRPELRIGFRSAGGNEIVDVEGLDLSQPLSMEDTINRITGVIDNGLFAHRPADLLVLARESGVEVLKAQV